MEKRGRRVASLRSSIKTGKDDASPDGRKNKRASAAGAHALPALAGGGGIFKSAAIGVLRRERKLMTTGDITRSAIENGLIKCQGKTPEATMASALYTDVKRKLEKSVFTRPQEGLFGLREWIAEGFFPEGWVGNLDGLGLAPFKKRSSSTANGVAKPRAATARAPRAAKVQAATWDDEPEEDIPEGETTEETAEDAEEEDTVPSATAEEAAAEEEDEVQGAAGVGVGTSGRTKRGSKDSAAAAAHAAGKGDAASQKAELHVDEKPAVPTGTAGTGSGAATASVAAKHDTGQEQTSCGVMPSPRQAGSKRNWAAAQDTGLASPLHVLGHAAAQTAPKGSARKRQHTVEVPSARRPSINGAEIITPKSPYVDSLAALHEIATSPLSYAPNGLLGSRSLQDLAGMQQQDGSAVANPNSWRSSSRSRKPKLQVELPGNGNEQVVNGLTLPTPGSLFSPNTAHAMMQGLDSMQGVGRHSMLLQSPLTTANGGGLFSNPRDQQHGNGRLGNNGLQLSIPSTLQSPGPATFFNGLDTNGILNLSLPDHMAGTPDQLLISPTGQLLAGYGSYGGGRRFSSGLLTSRGQRAGPQLSNGFRVPPPRRSSDGTFRVPNGLPPRAPASKPPLTTADAEIAEIGRVQLVVERLEAKLGQSHPQVGKAWLSLARMYHHAGRSGAISMDKAAEALQRAWAVCRSCAECFGQTTSCDASFSYLKERVAAGRS